MLQIVRTLSIVAILAALFPSASFAQSADSFQIGAVNFAYVARTSKAGKPRHVVLTEEGQRLFVTLIAGKFGKEPIFTRSDGGLWGKSHQLRPMVEASKQANIKPAVSFHVLRHTHGSTLAMRGVPFGVIAQQLGHADTRMTEKHYAHLAPSYVADTIRLHFPVLGIAGETNIHHLKR